MKKHIRTYSRVLLAVALGLPVLAQEKAGIDVQFRGRFGYGLSKEDNLTHRAIGLGLELGYTTPVGRFAAELGFQHKPGNQYLFDYRSAPIDPDNPGITLLPNLSGDLRQTSLQGMTLRASYEYDFNGGWLARCGVQLGGAKFRQDVRANVAYRNPDVYENAIITDAYAGNFEESGINPSPFIGFGKRFGISTLEFNIVFLSYKATDYVHVAGTGGLNTAPGSSTNNPGYNNSKDYFEESSRMIPHIEIAYAFRF
jgi:hypothetical protein